MLYQQRQTSEARYYIADWQEFSAFRALCPPYFAFFDVILFRIFQEQAAADVCFSNSFPQIGHIYLFPRVSCFRDFIFSEFSSAYFRFCARIFSKTIFSEHSGQYFCRPDFTTYSLPQFWQISALPSGLAGFR